MIWIRLGHSEGGVWSALRVHPRMPNFVGTTRQSGPIPTMAIVSARAGMTDMLVSVVDAALVDIDRAESVLNTAI